MVQIQVRPLWVVASAAAGCGVRRADFREGGPFRAWKAAPSAFKSTDRPSRQVRARMTTQNFGEACCDTVMPTRKREPSRDPNQSASIEITQLPVQVPPQRIPPGVVENWHALDSPASGPPTHEQLALAAAHARPIGQSPSIRITAQSSSRSLAPGTQTAVTPMAKAIDAPWQGAVAVGVGIAPSVGLAAAVGGAQPCSASFTEIRTSSTVTRPSPSKSPLQRSRIICASPPELHESKTARTTVIPVFRWRIASSQIARMWFGRNRRGDGARTQTEEKHSVGVR